MDPTLLAPLASQKHAEDLDEDWLRTVAEIVAPSPKRPPSRRFHFDLLERPEYMLAMNLKEITGRVPRVDDAGVYYVYRDYHGSIRERGIPFTRHSNPLDAFRQMVTYARQDHVGPPLGEHEVIGYEPVKPKK